MSEAKAPAPAREYQPFYIGYQTAADFLRGVPPGSQPNGGPPLFLHSTSTTRSSGWMKLREFSVTCARVEGNICHYVRTRLGRVEVFGNENDEREPVKGQLERAVKRATDLAALWRRYLADHGYSLVLEASVSAPLENWSTLDAQPEFAHWTGDVDGAFVYVETIPCPVCHAHPVPGPEGVPKIHHHANCERHPDKVAARAASLERQTPVLSGPDDIAALGGIGR